MSDDDKTPDVEEIKERLKIEIPVEEEVAEAADAVAEGGGDVVEELRTIGRQFADTLRTAWDSDQRSAAEGEIREGVQQFASEVDKMINDLRSGSQTDRIREEAADLRSKVETGEITRKARTGLVSGLRWLGKEFGNLADQFSPEDSAENTPSDE